MRLEVVIAYLDVAVLSKEVCSIMLERFASGIEIRFYLQEKSQPVSLGRGRPSAAQVELGVTSF
jgi:hypothetical protein